jgi:hypothetical protein
VNVPVIIDALTGDAPLDHDELDPRYVFLVRAKIRLFLVDVGELSLSEAFSDLVDTLRCPCERETVKRWEQQRPSKKTIPHWKSFSTSRSTIDAILYCVRQRGLGALKEPANRERLRRCDEKARIEINRCIATLLRRAT